MHYIAPPASGCRDLRREHLGFWQHIRDVAATNILLHPMNTHTHDQMLSVALARISVLEEFGLGGWEMTR